MKGIKLDSSPGEQVIRPAGRWYSTRLSKNTSFVLGAFCAEKSSGIAMVA